jgi:hypothetical protein
MKLTKKQLEEKVKVICYGEEKTYTRKKAIEFFRRGIICCDPNSSECERYMNIYAHLMAGAMVAKDE